MGLSGPVLTCTEAGVCARAPGANNRPSAAIDKIHFRTLILHSSSYIPVYGKVHAPRHSAKMRYWCGFATVASQVIGEKMVVELGHSWRHAENEETEGRTSGSIGEFAVSPAMSG